MTDDRVEEVKKNILSPSQWGRILYMVFYAIACWLLILVIPVIVVCQVVIALLSGKDNRNLRDMGARLAAYFHSALDYLLYVNDDKIWPFQDDDDDDEDLSDNLSATDPADDVKKYSSDDDASAAVKTTASENNAMSATAESVDSGVDEDVFADISFTESTTDTATQEREQKKSKSDDDVGASNREPDPDHESDTEKKDPS